MGVLTIQVEEAKVFFGEKFPNICSACFSADIFFPTQLVTSGLVSVIEL